VTGFSQDVTYLFHCFIHVAPRTITAGVLRDVCLCIFK